MIPEVAGSQAGKCRGHLLTFGAYVLGVYSFSDILDTLQPCLP